MSCCNTPSCPHIGLVWVEGTQCTSCCVQLLKIAQKWEYGAEDSVSQEQEHTWFLSISVCTAYQSLFSCWTTTANMGRKGFQHVIGRLTWILPLLCDIFSEIALISQSWTNEQNDRYCFLKQYLWVAWTFFCIILDSSRYFCIPCVR